MKLSLELLCFEIESLSEPVLSPALAHEKTAMLLKHCAFYDSGEPLRSEILYLVTEKQLSAMDFLSLPADIALTMILPKTTVLPEPLSNISYAWPLDGTPMEKIVNHIFKVFVKYDTIDRKLTESILHGESLQNLVTIADALFENEITIRDNNHRYVAKSYGNILFIDDEDQPDSDGYSSIDEINCLKHDANYEEHRASNAPFFYTFGDHTLLCMDIYYGNTHLYRVKISNAKRPFRPYDKDLLLYFSEIILCQCLDSRPGTQIGYKGLRNHILLLLEHKTCIDEENLSLILGTFGWNIQDNYLVICMQPGQNKGNIKAYSYYSRYLEKHISEMTAVEWEDSLVLVANLTKGYKDNEQVLLKIIAEYIRDENHRAGISNVCASLLLLHSYYSQARAALSQGLRHEPEKWTYPFSRYRFHYLKEILNRDFPDLCLLIPNLNLLYSSDDSNGTEYIKTLETYLLCQGNVAKASRLLNIHHSTLTYRLERISEILNISFDDLESLLWLNLILYLKQLV